MAQNITLLGASYSDVPSVLLPKTGGGQASFTDVTDTTAAASDVAQGKYFYTAAGVKTEGTSTGGGGGGNVYQDENGYLVLDDDPPSGQITVEPLSVTTNGTYTAPTGKAYSPVSVNVSGGGGSGSLSDPIRFFDYDGTLVASYSSVPASMPSVPTHTGLTNGTWNYTLQEVTAQFNAMGTCDVGANYTTSSGATEIDIELQAGRLHPYLSLAVNGTVSIDWGDNSTPDSVTGTSLTTRIDDIHHEYSAPGSYTIKIAKTSGTGYSLLSTTTYYLLNNNKSTQNENAVYASAVRAVRIGANCTIGASAFYHCYHLEAVSIPSSITSLGDSYAFGYCYGLYFVAVPSGVTSIPNNTFYSGYNRKAVSLPTSVTSIGASAFYNCYTLDSVSIPSGVTSIGNMAFNTCYNLLSIVLPDGISSLSSNIFNNDYSLVSVNVPSSATTINASAFSNCRCISILNIPSSVTSIGNSAFNNCYGMKEYHFTRTDSVPTLGTTAFASIPSDCIIYVPSSKLNDYKTAENWSTYASYMVGE